MYYNSEIDKLLDRLDRLASELRDSDLKQQYDTKENHIATVRAAQSMLIALQSELKNN